MDMLPPWKVHSLSLKALGRPHARDRALGRLEHEVEGYQKAETSSGGVTKRAFWFISHAFMITLKDHQQAEVLFRLLLAYRQDIFSP